MRHAETLDCALGPLRHGSRSRPIVCAELPPESVVGWRARTFFTHFCAAAGCRGVHDHECFECLATVRYRYGMLRSSTHRPSQAQSIVRKTVTRDAKSIHCSHFGMARTETRFGRAEAAPVSGATNRLATPLAAPLHPLRPPRHGL